MLWIWGSTPSLTGEEIFKHQATASLDRIPIGSLVFKSVILEELGSSINSRPCAYFQEHERDLYSHASCRMTGSCVAMIRVIFKINMYFHFTLLQGHESTPICYCLDFRARKVRLERKK